MPSTADEQVAAARMVFGKPKDERAVDLMKRWLNLGCRDWRQEASEGDGDVVVSAVFATPIKGQNLRMQVAQQVKRWGFVRRGHQQANLKFLTIDEYMKEGVGELVLRRARELIQKGVQKHQDRAEFIARIRKERLQEKLREKQRQKLAPELRLVLKGFWTNAQMNCGLKRQAKGWQSFRDDPVKKRRRLTRGMEFEDLEKYDENGEPIWARLDARRQR